MIVVCEPQCRGEVHVPFNAALLATLTAEPVYEMAPGGVVFLAEGGHLERVRALLGQRGGRVDRIRWIQMPVAHPRGAGRVARLTSHVTDHRAMLRAAVELEARHVLFASCSVEGLLGLRVTMAGMRPGRQPSVIAVPHAALSRLNSPSLLVRRATQAILHGGASLGPRLLMLTPETHAAFAADHPRLAPHLDWVHHPYLFPDLPPPRERSEADPVRFGFLGAASRYKGFHTFLRLARAVRGHDLGSAASFVAIGFRTDAFDDGELAVLDEVPAESPHSREEFERRAISLDYVVVPSDEEYYRYAASGVVLDCLSYGIPLITLASTHLGRSVESMPGLAEIAADFDSLVERVIALSTGVLNEETITARRRAMLECRRRFTPDAVATRMRTLLTSASP